jgi:hypothetical protein
MAPWLPQRHEFYDSLSLESCGARSSSLMLGDAKPACHAGVAGRLDSFEERLIKVAATDGTIETNQASVLVRAHARGDAYHSIDDPELRLNPANFSAEYRHHLNG